MIASGELQAGEWLRQERLASELGISYTPIREALKLLEVEGLVEHVPYRGVRVVKFNAEDVLDLYVMRSVLEGLAASGAARHISAEALAPIRALHERMCKLNGVKDLIEIHDLNRQFHLAIIRASQRQFLTRMLTMLYNWFPNMLWNRALAASEAALDARAAADNREHALIVVALEAHDPVAAERAMRDHIEGSSQNLLDGMLP